MTALEMIQTVVDDTTATISGAGRVAVAPLSANRTTAGELNSFVKNEVGTILDGVLIVPSTALVYALATERNDDSYFYRLGKGAVIGVVLYAASGILRRVVL